MNLFKMLTAYNSESGKFSVQSILNQSLQVKRHDRINHTSVNTKKRKISSYIGPTELYDDEVQAVTNLNLTITSIR